MQTVLPSEFKRGMVLVLEGTPQVVEEFYVTGSAQTRHKLHTRLRNLRTGRFTDHVFTDSERVAVAELEHRRVLFSYQQGDTYVFTDALSFDELSLPAELIGDRKGFLKDEVEYRAVFLEGKLVDLTFPAVVSLRVTDTAPPRSGGSDATWKPATVETGLEIMVPLFIDRDEVVRVDTTTRRYLGKETPSRK
jgi:elongation factor P